MARSASHISFDALRNAIYHSARRGFLDTLNRVMNFIVVAAGASAIGDLGRFLHVDSGSKVLVAVATLAGLLQLVFDFAGLARTHEFLQKRFYELVAEISETGSPTDADCARWDAMLNRLYAEEKPPMRALDAVAYNAAVDALGRGAAARIPVSWWQSLLRQLWPFNGTAF
jgi:hypothetical protein